VITSSAPRFASNEDLERVSLLLNQRMLKTRRMERELAWLQETLNAERNARRRGDVPTVEPHNRDATTPPQDDGRIGRFIHRVVWAVLALGPLRPALEPSTFGRFLLVLAAMSLAYNGVHLTVSVVQLVGDMIEGRRQLHIARRLPESELVQWHRDLRLRECHRASSVSDFAR